MAKNIQYQMDLHNKTRNEICKDLGFAYSTFADWLNAKKYPRIDKIEMMANYFGIQKSDLVEDQSVIPIDPEVAKFMFLVNQMTPEELAELTFQARHILDRRRKS